MDNALIVSAVAHVAAYILDSGAVKATKYLSPKQLKFTKQKVQVKKAA